MRVVNVSEVPVAGPMLNERLLGLYKRRKVVNDLIRSLEQYGRVQPGNHGQNKTQAPVRAQGVIGLLL
jgi:hypothetical protein